jgi:hypothetical protein
MHLSLARTCTADRNCLRATCAAQDGAHESGEPPWRRCQAQLARVPLPLPPHGLAVPGAFLRARGDHQLQGPVHCEEVAAVLWHACANSGPHVSAAPRPGASAEGDYCALLAATVGDQVRKAQRCPQQQQQCGTGAIRCSSVGMRSHPTYARLPIHTITSPTLPINAQQLP